MGIKIKNLPISERPRERFINSNIDEMSNEDLLAIILKTGSKNISVKDISQNVLSLIKDINELSTLNYNKLITITGIGPVKAITLLSAIELGRRVNLSKNNILNKQLTSSNMIYNYYKEKLKDKKQEYFYTVYLDSNKRIIKEKLLFIGTLNYSLIHPREIFKEACINSASSFICVHNHPSGSILPSKMDKILTNQLNELGKNMGIPLIDHLIIGIDNYYSFFDNNHL